MFSPKTGRARLGEAANYDQSPDAWLVQYSGIPYGLMSEMLYGGANRWRGLVFGMTGRLGHCDYPQPFWRAWDGFGMQGAEIGDGISTAPKGGCLLMLSD